MNFFRLWPLFFSGGALYCGIELLWRRRTHISMFFLGGICFVLIGLLDELAPSLPLSMQAMLGAAIITVFELLAGLVLNRWLRLGVWDYSALRPNLLGQICLPFFAAWIPLAALAALADDLLRLLFFGEKMPRPPLL